MNPVNRTVALHAATPAVAAPFRALAFLRTPSAPEAPARPLVSRTVVHPFSRTTRLFGARALNNTATGNADAVTVSGLAGQPLCLHTADGDAAFTLPDVAGRPLWSRNAQGTVSTAAYEAANAGGRPLSLSETALGVAVGRVREQYTYAPLAEAKWQALNLAGSRVELRNNAGISRPLSISLTGQPLASEQRLLKPEIETPDWATTTADDTEAPLRIIGTYDATGAPLATTNAAGVTSLIDYAINGAVAQTRLAYTEQGSAKEAVTLKDIRYRADGVVLSQTAGNGVIDRYEYDPKTQLLRRHLTERPEGHPKGPLVISDLHYRYDPVGNITRLEDQGADPTWHANQQAIGLREYTYDTLYRLISATGRERTPVARYHGAEASSGSVWAPYSEHYTYDDGNNLTTIRHVGGAGNRTRELQVSEGSNRAMVKGHSLTPETGFLAGGLQKQLADGRALQWLADNQLGKVTPVSRVDGDDDSERYHYADGGTRTRKVHTAQASAGMQTTITTYAGGCETRQRWLAGKNDPQKHIVITEGSGIRVVEDRLTGAVHLRYGFADHLGSVGGETDELGKLISREEYAPYGGTVGRDEAAEEVSNLTQRTMRYSGKEQDATGLYYYGWRYYQPDVGRWLSADPDGLVEWINLYCFCQNNSLNRGDKDGRNSKRLKEIYEKYKLGVEQKLFVESAYDVALEVLATTLGERTDREVMGQAFESAKGEVRRALDIGRLKQEGLSGKIVYAALVQHRTNNIRKQSADRKEVAGKEIPDISNFLAIYSANAGHSEINASMRDGSTISLNMHAVVSELERRHEEEFKGAHGRSLKLNLKAIGGTLSTKIDDYKATLYWQGNRTLKTYYRGQGMSDAALNAFKVAVETGQVVHSKSFLSVSSSPKVADTFEKRAAEKNKVTFIIEGFSARGAYSRLGVDAESESLFSPHADFQVMKVARHSQGGHNIYLEEVRGYRGRSRPMYY
ncbi:RHS repeat protein [Pseudomonas putida]|nr:RHS repeat protein [Pseudomonas putida]